MDLDPPGAPFGGGEFLLFPLSDWTSKGVR